MRLIQPSEGVEEPALVPKLLALLRSRERRQSRRRAERSLLTFAVWRNHRVRVWAISLRGVQSFQKASQGVR